MGEDDQIKWVSVTLNFSPEQEAVLEAAAKRRGMSIQCYCVHLLYRELAEEAAERHQRELLATLRRNECPA